MARGWLLSMYHVQPLPGNDDPLQAPSTSPWTLFVHARSPEHSMVGTEEVYKRVEEEGSASLPL
jgi:hypothetical protein